MTQPVLPVLCRRCGAPLTGLVNADHITTCPNCGKRWQLDVRHAAIHTTTLTVQDADHKSAAPTVGEKHG